MSEYLVYEMSEEEGKKYNNTAPTSVVLPKSKSTGKRVSLDFKTLWETKNGEFAIYKDIVKALQALKLVAPNATAKDIDIDGDDEALGVWYKGTYRFTLVQPSYSDAYLNRVLSHYRKCEGSFSRKVALALSSLEVMVGAGQNPDMSPDPINCPVIPTKKIRVASLEEAVKKCQDFIEKHDVGGGSWYAANAGWVLQDGKKIARVAYNGNIDTSIKASAFKSKATSLEDYHSDMKTWALSSQENWEAHMAQIGKAPDKTSNFSEPDLVPEFLKATGMLPKDAAKITDKKRQEEIFDKHIASLKEVKAKAKMPQNTYAGRIAAMDNLDKLEFDAGQINKRLKDMVAELKAAGIKVLSAEDSDMDTDAEIKLEKNYHLQIGTGYVCLNKSSGSDDDFSVEEIASAKTIKEIIPKIKQELS